MKPATKTLWRPACRAPCAQARSDWTKRAGAYGAIGGTLAPAAMRGKMGWRGQANRDEDAGAPVRALPLRSDTAGTELGVTFAAVAAILARFFFLR